MKNSDPSWYAIFCDTIADNSKLWLLVLVFQRYCTMLYKLLRMILYDTHQMLQNKS